MKLRDEERERSHNKSIVLVWKRAQAQSVLVSSLFSRGWLITRQHQRKSSRRDSTAHALVHQCDWIDLIITLQLSELLLHQTKQLITALLLVSKTYRFVVCVTRIELQKAQLIPHNQSPPFFPTGFRSVLYHMTFRVNKRDYRVTHVIIQLPVGIVPFYSLISSCYVTLKSRHGPYPWSTSRKQKRLYEVVLLPKYEHYIRFPSF